MSMYRCETCEHVFEKPKLFIDIENHSELGAPASGYFKETFEWEGCPVCGSHEFERVEECPTCGKWTTEDHCDDCIDKGVEALEKLQNEIGASWFEVIELMEDVISKRW